MCKTHDLKTVLWTGTGNKCHVLQELVLSPLQQETCFMQNLKHATVPLTVVVSWALGQNSLGEKFHICKGGKSRNRSLAETYICVCVLLRVALSYKKRLWEFFQRLCIDEPATQSMANYGLFMDIGVHMYTWGHHMPTHRNKLALQNYWKNGMTLFLWLKKNMFPSPASDQTLPWGQSLIIFSECYPPRALARHHQIIFLN